MGEGEGMAQCFIGWAVSARRKGSRGYQAGLATCHMWATAVGFHAVQRHRWVLKMEGVPGGKKKETLRKKKGNEEKGADRWGRMHSG